MNILFTRWKYQHIFDVFFLRIVLFALFDTSFFMMLVFTLLSLAAPGPLQIDP